MIGVALPWRIFWNGRSTSATPSTAVITVHPSRARKARGIPRKSNSALNIHTSRRLTWKHGRLCRRYGRANAVPIKWARWICCLVWSTVRTAENGITSADAEAGTKANIHIPAALTTDIKKTVPRIPSRSWHCTKSCWRRFSGLRRKRGSTPRNSSGGRWTSTAANSKRNCPPKSNNWTERKNGLLIGKAVPRRL